MFGLSYAWHGVFLNDVANLHYPLSIYLISSSVVYLLAGFLLVKLFSSNYAIQMFRNFFARGLVSGALLGLVLYMVALVMGMTFTKGVTLTSILFDLPWQVFEQTFGGVVIAIVYVFIYEPIPINRSTDTI